RALQPSTPPSLDRIVRTCLMKDREDRWASIHDVLLLLREIDGHQADVAEQVRTERRPRREIAAWAMATIGAVAAIARWTLNRGDVQAPVSTTYVSLLPPSGTSLATEEPPLISPDGMRIVFVGNGAKGERQIYAQSLDSSEPARPLANTDGGSQPFWSPD